MNFLRHQFLKLAAVVAAAAAVPQLASALDYPTRPVRIIAGFAAGGGVDVTARLIGQWLTDRLGQSFVIENRPGARLRPRRDAGIAGVEVSWGFPSPRLKYQSA